LSESSRAYPVLCREWRGHTLRLSDRFRRGVPDYHWQWDEWAGFFELKLRDGRDKLTHPLGGGQLKFLRDYQRRGGLAAVLVRREADDSWELYANLEQLGVAQRYWLDDVKHLTKWPSLRGAEPEIVERMRSEARCRTYTRTELHEWPEGYRANGVAAY
jgi:hypothetical protein